MSIITKLTAMLTADSAQFEAGIKRAKGAFSGFQGVLVKGAGIASGAIATVGAAMVALGIRQAEVIGQNKDLADSLGLTYAEFQNLSLVAEETGASQTALATAITKTQQAVFDAANGVKSAQEKFALLGLSISELQKMSPAEQFQAIGTAIGTITDPATRTALAVELFGKSGRELINMLPELSAKIAEASEFNKKFGLSLEDVDAAKVEEAGDAFGRVGMVAQGAGNVIAVQFAPLVTEASNRLVEAAFSADDFASGIQTGMKAASYAIDLVRKAVLLFQTGYNSMILAVLEGTKKLTSLVGIETKALDANLDAMRNKTGALAQDLVDFEGTYKKIERIQQQAEQRAQNAPKSAGGAGLEDVLSRSTEKTKELTEKTEKLDDVWEKFGESSGNAIDTLISDLGRGGNALQSFRNFAVSMLQDVIKGLNGGTSIGQGIGSLIGQAFKGMAGSSYISSTYGVGGELGSTLGSLFSSSVSGSFATGIDKVPYDMNARVHKGEAIIPASQVDSMTSDGGTTINIDARGAGQGVEQKIRQVMAEVTQLRKDTPSIALNVVADQNRRNPNY